MTEAAPTPTPSFSLDELHKIDREKIRVNPETGCWEWTASKGSDGYGQAKRYGRNVRAHRHVYETLVGPLKVNLQHLDHLCRVRHCVNPAHMEPVTPMENSRRGLTVIRGELPEDLYQGVLRLVERAYKRGVHVGLRQADGGKGEAS